MGRTKSGSMRGRGRSLSDAAPMARPGPFVVAALVLAIVIGGPGASVATAMSRREPTLGSRSSSIYTFPGIGKVAPRTVNAQGDANSVVLHIRWKHWGRRKPQASVRATSLLHTAGTCRASGPLSFTPKTWDVAIQADRSSTGGSRGATPVLLGTTGITGRSGPTSSIPSVSSSAELAPQARSLLGYPERARQRCCAER
jgi:hypothetical protein